MVTFGRKLPIGIYTFEKIRRGGYLYVDKTERHYQVIVYLIFKLNGTAEDTLQKINKKGYAGPFKTGMRKLMKVGVEFSAETRNVKRWLVK